MVTKRHNTNKEFAIGTKIEYNGKAQRRESRRRTIRRRKGRI